MHKYLEFYQNPWSLGGSCFPPQSRRSVVFIQVSPLNRQGLEFFWCGSRYGPCNKNTKRQKGKKTKRQKDKMTK